MGSIVSSTNNSRHYSFHHDFNATSVVTQIFPDGKCEVQVNVDDNWNKLEEKKQQESKFLDKIIAVKYKVAQNAQTFSRIVAKGKKNMKGIGWQNPIVVQVFDRNNNELSEFDANFPAEAAMLVESMGYNVPREVERDRRRRSNEPGALSVIASIVVPVVGLCVGSSMDNHHDLAREIDRFVFYEENEESVRYAKREVYCPTEPKFSNPVE